MSVMDPTVGFSPDVSPQTYILSLMEEVEDEDEDIRIHTAASCGDEEGLKLLLRDENLVKKWINYRIRPYLAPPLRVAVTGGNAECVRLLIEAGAIVDLEDIKGQTPLFVASSLRKPECMKVLLEAGADPDGSKKNRCCPLLIAVRDGFAEGVKLLLQYGVNPEPFNQLTNNCVPGWPLQHSIVYKHFSSFHALLQGGAKASLCDLPFKVQPATIAKLSIPHSIVKYAGDHPEFVYLFHESGGDLHQVNPKDVMAADLDTECKALDAIRILNGRPLRLKSVCRNKIRKILGRSRLHNIDKLDIPPTLYPFLRFDEFDPFAKRTEENTHTKIPENETPES